MTGILTVGECEDGNMEVCLALPPKLQSNLQPKNHVSEDTAKVRLLTNTDRFKEHCQ